VYAPDHRVVAFYFRRPYQQEAQALSAFFRPSQVYRFLPQRVPKTRPRTGSSTSSAYPLVLVSVAEVVLSFLVHVVERVSELVIKWSAIMRFECMNDQ